jgi:hypothetical protein
MERGRLALDDTYIHINRAILSNCTDFCSWNGIIMIQKPFFIFVMCYILTFSLYIYIVSIFKIRFEHKNFKKKRYFSLVWYSPVNRGFVTFQYRSFERTFRRVAMFEEAPSLKSPLLQLLNTHHLPSNSGCGVEGEHSSKPLFEQLINRFSEHLHELATWLSSVHVLHEHT